MFGFYNVLIFPIIDFAEEGRSLIICYDTLPKFSIHIISSLIQDKYSA